MSRTVIAIGCAFTFALVNGAAGASFSPPDTTFKLKGLVEVVRGDRAQRCDGVFIGVTGHAGISGAKIRAATFTSPNGCDIVAAGLPWTLTATGPGAASLAGLAFTTGIACGPNTAPITVDAKGLWTIRVLDMRGGCSFATLPQSKPKITVVP